MLTEKQKQEIVCRRINGESLSSIAKSFNVSHTAISKILKDEKVSKSFNILKDETALDMISFLDNKKGQVQELITIILDDCKRKISKATLKESVSAINTLSEIFIDKEKPEETEELTVNVVVKDCSKKENDGT